MSVVNHRSFDAYMTTGRTTAFRRGQPGMWDVSDDGRDKWMEYQQRMLTGQTRIIRETPNGSRIMAIELTDAGRRALTVHPQLRPEVQRPRWRHRSSVGHLMLWALYAAACFAIGAVL